MTKIWHWPIACCEADRHPAGAADALPAEGRSRAQKRGQRMGRKPKLTGDLTEKYGQIAHIDKDPANYKEDNLAWLCLDHHSVFDSRTSQHKNYTQAEVKDARAALYLAIEQGKHSAQSVAPPQGRNADRQTLANIIGVMDRRTLILFTPTSRETRMSIRG